MEKRVEKALENRGKGYNCCQAVACAYCDLVGMDEQTMFRVAEGFGAGMGDMEGTCGAVAGTVLLAGLKNSDGNLASPGTKGSTYRFTKKILKEFREKNGSAVCKDLKGMESGKMLCSCEECVADAAALAEEVLFAEQV